MNETNIQELSEEQKPEVSVAQPVVKDEKEDPVFLAFVKQVGEVSDQEAKVQMILDFMEASIATKGRPNFRHFWEARKLFTENLKDDLAAPSRTKFWERSAQLSSEARQMKTLLQEQSAFAMEQIAIAITALEQDLAQFEKLIEKAEGIVFPEGCQAMAKNLAFFQSKQKELNILNMYASRINALRKELIRTEMRGKQKNTFFQKLSAAGDLIFPKRKELIRDVSAKFLADVSAFSKNYLESEEIENSLYLYREEIKSLQSMAKLVTLNTQVFNETRTILSQCWDVLKKQEKERKKEFAKKREEFSQNEGEIVQRLADFREKVKDPSMTPEVGLELLSEITQMVGQTELTHGQVKDLRAQIAAERKGLYDKVNESKREKEEQQKEKERKRKEELQNLKTKIQSLHTKAKETTLNDIQNALMECRDEMSNLKLSRAEKMEFDRFLKPVKDVMNEKKEQCLLDLPADAKAALGQLQDLLDQRKKRRAEIKEQLEQCRKSKGISGLDFEQAMAMSGQMDEERLRLEKVEEGIREIEEKIANLRKS